MRLLFIVCLVLILPQLANAQKEIQLDINFIEQMRFTEQENLLEQKLHCVFLYNKTLEDFGKKDFITCTLEDDKFGFHYKGAPLNNFFNPKEGHNSPIVIRGKYTAHSFLLSFYTYLEDDRFYKFNLIRKDGGDFAIHSNYKNGMYDGAYIEKYLSAETTTSGNYTQIDSFYLDTIETFDPNTYESNLSITEKEKISVKCGIWKYATEDGDKIKVYQKCN